LKAVTETENVLNDCEVQSIVILSSTHPTLRWF
jgi:hypothetical protein